MGTVLDDILELGADNPADRAALKRALRVMFSLASKGATAALPSFSVSPALVDYQISLIDEKLSAQVNAILHHGDFLALEASWRGLLFLTSRLEFDQNILLVFMNISKEDLLKDFQDSLEITRSGLYRHIYTEEFGQFGGKPVAAIIADYLFGPSPRDIQLLHYVGSVASMAHAPFFAAADKDFFGLKGWSGLPDIKDLPSVFEAPRYARWHSFREHPNARYIGLTLPGFLLRLPYGELGAPPVSSFSFEEDTDSEDFFCWGNTAFALAARLGASFASYRWCVNIIGSDGGGKVENLLCSYHEAMSGIQDKIPTRAVITERREFELAEQGFIPLAIGNAPNEAVFFSANSVLRPQRFAKNEEGIAAEVSYRLSTQFPYMLLINRLAHYIKVLQRENMGNWREKNELARELNRWISQYVTAMDTPDALTRSRRPLRMAHIDVKEQVNEAGWYSVTMKVRPHFKYMGVNFTLSLEGKLERQTSGENNQG